ncbi:MULTISPECIES: hypothetical protein [Streptomyces]|uniref:hypothetical protein n=1 Tax=Streptomyces TaxID=1883 RepID=UPI00163BAE7E|nr:MULTISPECIES: hypothetical protein [Streptomyces]MBC2874773.1 hypothetical protein [Streptomyces sp. TYQ1024]UBI37225.1 hypothetical protein K7I03_12635 [Streptomyces mobaraensis]UKW29817.1 hypothetical protein MCU78_12610 [Streptomyces sp. TYQ1024]
MASASAFGSGRRFASAVAASFGPRPGSVAVRERRSPERQGREGSERDGDGRGEDDGRGGHGANEADNPFAAPPADRPDQPWRPREPRHGGGSDGSSGSEGQDGSGQPPAWGSQWSSRQPGRHSGGFGGPQGGGQDPANGGTGGGPRWDPTDPAQRRARYALLAGLWGFFFALFSLPEIALLLGALSVYWAVSSLRAKNGRRNGDGPAPAPAPQPGGFRPQTTAAVSGLVMGGLALVIVVSTFTFQLIYRDYYTCVDDALTQTSRQSCENHLPKPLRPLLSVDD